MYVWVKTKLRVGQWGRFGQAGKGQNSQWTPFKVSYSTALLARLINGPSLQMNGPSI